ncbi:cell division protein FtsQ/DivIB [Oricola sp.]|uniref:cell division protein FtsQ/DivIB n=1 Tax=Oricola sp. TaxID=1979950 RepID=UPI003BACC0F5
MERTRRAAEYRDDEAGFVLPRILRRPARFFTKVFDGEVRVPRHVEAVGLVALFSATALYGSVIGGQFHNTAVSVTASLGFAVTEVEITGHRNTTEKAVIDALELNGETSLVVLDLAGSRAALSALPWVESASLRKVYPGRLEVALVEKDAFAIWQAGETLSLIERDGSVIGTLGGNGFKELPLVVGAGAAESAASFMDVLAGYPELASQVRALIRVGDRRWDLRLASGVTVKLPAERPGAAIQRLLAMDAETGLLKRDIASVDMRLEDRTAIALTDNAGERRDAALKARAKALKSNKRSSI